MALIAGGGRIALLSSCSTFHSTVTVAPAIEGAMMETTTRSGLAGAMHVIFRRDGRLIAHPTRGKEILATKGQLRMQESGPALASMYRAVTNAGAQPRLSGYDPGSGLHYLRSAPGRSRLVLSHNHAQ
jgi:hypothetical protein